MKLVDANVLLHAVNADAPQHELARSWLDGALSGAGTVAFDWVALLAFVRLATKAAIFPSPLSPEQAFGAVDAWLGPPTSVVLTPSPDHARTMARLLAGAGGGGNLVNDAHLAALALSSGATVVTFDRDFARFDGVPWMTPAG